MAMDERDIQSEMHFGLEDEDMNVIEYNLTYTIEINGQKATSFESCFDKIMADKLKDKWEKRGYTVTIETKERKY